MRDEGTGRPERKKPAKGVHIHDKKPTIVFLTVCTKGRKEWLAKNTVHDGLVNIWKDATAWKVGRYVIMPDHFHLFAGYTGSEISLDNWILYWKRLFSKKDAKPENRWQSHYWDRRLRTDESYEVKWDYIRNNPVRHGLVERAEDWPYQGEIFELPW